MQKVKKKLIKSFQCIMGPQNGTLFFTPNSASVPPVGHWGMYDTHTSMSYLATMIQPATPSQAFKYHSGHLRGSKIELSPIATKLGRHEPTATNTTHTKFPHCAYASPVIDDRHMTIVVIANPLVFGHMA